MYFGLCYYEAVVGGVLYLPVSSFGHFNGIDLPMIREAIDKLWSKG